ncbi:hypothetical protein ADH70_011900 [Blautia pseudococcoides]|uniref:Uncharacterized protein n=1 Tax=Blautia pseudococcoides TaxID=1796616 RepID=A0A1C7IAQ1_9FIRM|nr:hypothetical protein A4V09_13420 [Blautia pseudococcoides]ASU29483.1 hypothetical protein ADH70_011900 [Blautia pseudococcoides]
MIVSSFFRTVYYYKLFFSYIQLFFSGFLFLLKIQSNGTGSCLRACLLTVIIHGLFRNKDLYSNTKYIRICVRPESYTNGCSEFSAALARGKIRYGSEIIKGGF